MWSSSCINLGKEIVYVSSRSADIHLDTAAMLAVDSSVQRPEDKASAMELSDLIAAELAGS